MLSAVVAETIWLITAAGVAWHRAWLGPVAVLLVIAWRLADRDRRGGVLRACLVALIAGVIGDGILASAGVLQFHGGAGVLVPLWMLALWVNLALALDALAWARERPWLALVIGAVGGPLSYRFGETLGVLVLGPTPAVAVLAIAIEWAIAVPLLLWLAVPPPSARAALAAREVLS